MVVGQFLNHLGGNTGFEHLGDARVFQAIELITSRQSESLAQV